MYNKDISTYNWFVDTLREAYMNDTLEAGHPCRCGVGNLLSKRYTEIHGVPVDELAFDKIKRWANVFSTNRLADTFVFSFMGIVKYNTARKAGKFRQCSLANGDHVGEEVLRWLPVPKQVLMDLEWEFETNQIGESKDEQMFNGLMASIVVLDKYFEIPPVTQQQTKEEFSQVRKPSLCLTT